MMEASKKTAAIRASNLLPMPDDTGDEVAFCRKQE